MRTRLRCVNVLGANGFAFSHTCDAGVGCSQRGLPIEEISLALLPPRSGRRCRLRVPQIVEAARLV